MATPPTLPPPLAFASWLTNNSDKLQPPVNNFCLFSGTDFVLMVVGGPNARNDFHGKQTFPTITNLEAWEADAAHSQ